MQDFWIQLWSLVWFGGLAIFSVLAVLVTVFGGADLIALLASLRRRHFERQAADTAPSQEPPGQP
ncbi:MAG: hypothetical protein AB7W28_09375 [Armatimonadota bacterium]